VKEEAMNFSTKDFGRFLAAVRGACDAPGGMSVNKLEWRGVGGAAGASQAVPADGGFIVPEEFSRVLVERIYLDEVIGRCFQMPMKSSSLAYPQFDESSRADGSRFGGVQSYWGNEADSATATKPKFLKSTLTAKKLIALSYLTDELIADSDALGVFAMEALTNELRFRLTDAIVNGDGSGKPQGILSAGALVTVAKAGGQAAATIVGQNVTDMWRSMWAPCRKNAVWLCHPDAEAQLINMAISVGSGGSELPLYIATTDPERQPFNLMLGRPVIPIEQAQYLGAPGDLILVDLSRYMVALRSLNQAVSMHINFVTDEMALRLTMRVDGQPIDPRPVTQFTSSPPNQVSSFVAIARR
jgi:HK97 family phage major capsid protein